MRREEEDGMSLSLEEDCEEIKTSGFEDNATSCVPAILRGEARAIIDVTILVGEEIRLGIQGSRTGARL